MLGWVEVVVVTAIVAIATLHALGTVLPLGVRVRIAGALLALGQFEPLGPVARWLARRCNAPSSSCAGCGGRSRCPAAQEARSAVQVIARSSG